MRGIASVDLAAIVGFLYNGEANVFQENFDSFLAIAEELQLKGLKGSNDQNESNETELQKEPLSIKPEQKYRKDRMISDTGKAGTKSNEQCDELDKVENNVLMAISIPVSADSQHLDQTVKSMMETS